VPPPRSTIVVLCAFAGALACAKKNTAPAPAAADAGARDAGSAVRDAGRDALRAASFDCKKAGTKIERMICASPELSRLDGEVAVAFKQALAVYQKPRAVRAAQRGWLLETRNQAENEDQLKEAYTARLEQLRGAVDERKEVVRGELAWQMVDYGDDGVVLPRITRWRNAKVKKRINAALAELASKMACAGIEVEPGASPHEFSMNAEVSYAANDIFSVEIHSEYYCSGTAHGSHDDNSSMTFDLRTGDEASFEGLFADYGKDKDAILKALFGEDQAPSTDPDHDVLTLATIAEHGIAFSFHEDGLEVQPVLPYVIAALAESVTVPYADLRKLADRKGLLARIKN
jgi:uncharacterized protein